ncbi:Ax21 family protein [Xanthomonas nasturtii]|uniref:Ax21 family protein n=1 Tax=Xanthomonas nasturtii TaxID=1843581 RepID=A0A3E1KQB7_9XANT|nr:Ax21 family protein [Xanthomonas nasturtii]MCL1499787.1 Ax21 family protein [Xanthomonas nasturtii]MCL1503359.1 Ax21 family protein [Xanthomonas nasturtii]MCL1521924.1 Ax21 family protein [Xanthomonas nasturtii]MCL1526081.1 Ax21 family protein [Xanthomonas nasturtii]MCL1528880.1 Ax21 family protein [Xanthomonas nasturtii]
MKNSLLALGLLAALPFAASAAENISYNFVEGNYVRTPTEGRDADGWGVKASYAVAPNFHVFGDYSKQTADDNNGVFQSTNSDFQQWGIGAGYNHEIATATDFLARVSYRRLDLDTPNINFDGFSVETGLRTSFGEHIEVYALAGYEDFSEKRGIDLDDTFYGRLGAQVKLNQNWGINGDIRMDGDGNKEWSVGPRFSW